MTIRASVVSRATLQVRRRCLSADTATALSALRSAEAITGTTAPIVSTRDMSMIASQEIE